MKFLKKYFYQIAVPLLLLVMFGIMFTTARGDSTIVDEIAHIPAGFSYITKGDYRLNPEHPPLIKDLAAVPLVLAGMKFPYDYWQANSPVVNNQWETGWRFIYRFGNDADTVKILAEIPMMLLSLLFGYFVYRWAKELYGNKAGLFALILFVFNTNIIAHSRFVTTDLGISFAFFLNMYFLYKYLKNPNWKSLIWTGVTFGIVLVTKFSAAVLLPTYFLVWLLLIAQKGKVSTKDLLSGINDKKWFTRAKSGLIGMILIGIIGVAFMWLFYIPHTINMPAQVQKDLIAESNVPFTPQLQAMSNNFATKALAQWILGFLMVTSHVEGGHDAFLLGQVSNQGWWYYYPVTIAIKTQIPIFIFLFLVIAFWKKLEHKEWFTSAFLWTLPLVLIAMGMQGKINLGIRYMLPVYAFLFVFIAPLANWITKENLTKLKNNVFKLIASWLVVLLTVWYVASAILIYPHYLAYYNEFVGGYKNGYKYLTDSNTDWGQDIKRLNTWAEENDVKTIYVDAFPGGFPVSFYLGDKAIEWHVQNGRPTGYFAVSATFYQNSKLKKAQNGVDYSWLDNLTPIENIGGSILIYDLK